VTSVLILAVYYCVAFVQSVGDVFMA